MKRDMTRLEAAEMRFLRSVKGYTRLDKIRSEIIRKELEIPGIQDVGTKYKQNWINHLERTDNKRLPKHTLNYKPRRRRDRACPRNRWQRIDAGTGQTTYTMEEKDDDDDDDDNDDDELCLSVPRIVAIYFVYMPPCYSFPSFDATPHSVPPSLSCVVSIVYSRITSSTLCSVTSATHCKNQVFTIHKRMDF